MRLDNAYLTLLVMKHGFFIVGEQFTDKKLFSKEFGLHKCAIFEHTNFVGGGGGGKLNPFCG